MQRYFAINKENDELILRESDIHHITKVMRMKKNDKIEVVFDNELFIAEFDDQIKIIEKIDTKINLIPNVNMIVPLLKEQKLDYILQKATEMGVSDITIIDTERTIVKMEEKKIDKKEERWTAICKEAAEQSKRIDFPKVKYIKKLTNLEGKSFICSVGAKVSFKNHLKTLSVYDKINVLIGPEGGFSKKEEDYFESIGFEKISLGDRVLRAETAPLFIMSIINYEYMEWYNDKLY